jgi:hypothetical protein
LDNALEVICAQTRDTYTRMQNAPRAIAIKGRGGERGRGTRGTLLNS